MRKALIGLILAATVMTPVAAEAQRRGQNQRAEQTQRNEQRSEQRQARQEARQQNRQARNAPRQAQGTPPQPQVQVAQRERRGDGNRGNRGADTPAWQGPTNTPEMRRHAERYNRVGRQNAIRYGNPEQRREAQRVQRRVDRREDRRDWRNDRRDDRRDWRDDRRGWNSGWRNDRRYDWRGWRNSNRHIFRSSRYYAPYRGWNYRRFNIGLILQPLFYNQRYWIGDPWQYRLPPAPYGTQWVRYYDDVLLVDVYTGEVVDAIYDFYW